MVLNDRYFESKYVIEILNNPNFVAANGISQRDLFLYML